MLQNKFLIECKNGDDWLVLGCSVSAAEQLGGVGGARWKTDYRGEGGKKIEYINHKIRHILSDERFNLIPHPADANLHIKIVMRSVVVRPAIK